MAREHQTLGPTPENIGDWLAQASPLYNRRAVRDPDSTKRAVLSTKVLFYFGQGEGRTFDMRAGLRDIQCPTLVMGGEDDPQTPIEYQEDIAAAIPPHLVQFERFADAGHGPYRDDAEAVFAAVRKFILS